MANSNASQKMRQIAESSQSSKEAHFAALGVYTDEVLHSQVLCMTYVQPEKTSGGIILIDKSRDEDRFQGKISLVIAMGPGAFVDDAVAKFHGKKIEVGDWVLVRPSDGMEIFYNGCSLRLFQDVDVRMRINDPMKFW
jgi:co-chaperonin GroES (HSP10)